LFCYFHLWDCRVPSNRESGFFAFVECQ
jgi:hypothetical protein